MLQKVESFNRKAIVAAGGRKLNLRKFDDLASSSVYYHPTDFIAKDFSAHILSTKAMAYHVCIFSIYTSRRDSLTTTLTTTKMQTIHYDAEVFVSQLGLRSPSMVEVFLSSYAQQKTIGQVIVAHPAVWLREIPDSVPPQPGTLTSTENRDSTEEIKTNLAAYRRSKSVFYSASSTPTTTTTSTSPLSFSPFLFPSFSALTPPFNSHNPTIAGALSLFDELNQQIYLNFPTGAMLEGGIFTSVSKLHYFFRLAQSPFIRTVCEVGFNAGHSALLWLHANPSIKVYAFDLFQHKYSKLALENVNMHFPGIPHHTTPHHTHTHTTPQHTTLNYITSPYTSNNTTPHTKTLPDRHNHTTQLHGYAALHYYTTPSLLPPLPHATPPHTHSLFSLYREADINKRRFKGNDTRISEAISVRQV